MPKEKRTLSTIPYIFVEIPSFSNRMMRKTLFLVCLHLLVDMQVQR